MTSNNLARVLDPPRLRRALAHVRDALAPEAAEDAAEHAHQRRGLSASETLHGMVALDGLLDPEGGALLLAALQPLAAPTGPDDKRTPRQRRADALTELARRQLDQGDLPTTGGERPHLTVLVPLDTLHHPSQTPPPAASSDTASPADADSPAPAQPDTPGPAGTSWEAGVEDPISTAAGETDAPKPAGTGWAADLDDPDSAATGETDTPRPADSDTAASAEDTNATAGETDAPGPADTDTDTDTAATTAPGSGEHPAEGGEREPVAQTSATTEPGPAAEPIGPHAPVNPYPPARAAGASVGVPAHPAAAAPTPAGPRAVGPWFAGPHAAETEWAGPISAEAARRLACDAIITRVITHGASQPLDVGRRTRTIPPAIRTALTVRDRGCAWPDCDRPPPWTDAHHIIPWARGGATNLDNLVLLCRRHHRCVHEGRWRLTRTPDGQWTAAPPERASPAASPVA